MERGDVSSWLRPTGNRIPRPLHDREISSRILHAVRSLRQKLSASPAAKLPRSLRTRAGGSLPSLRFRASTRESRGIQLSRFGLHSLTKSRLSGNHSSVQRLCNLRACCRSFFSSGGPFSCLWTSKVGKLCPLGSRDQLLSGGNGGLCNRFWVVSPEYTDNNTGRYIFSHAHTHTLFLSYTRMLLRYSRTSS